MNRTIVLTAMLTLGLAIFGVSLSPMSAARADDAAEKEGKTIDRLVMVSGKVIEGRVLEETADSVKFEVHYPGLPPVTTTYSKRDILDIKRGVAVKEDASVGNDEGDDDEPAKNYDDEAAKIYYFSINNNLGQDFSVTPLRRILADANKVFDDADSSGAVVESARDKNIIVIKLACETGPDTDFDKMFNLKDPLIDELTRGRKVIFWVERAVNGAAVFPFMSPDIYFTSNGRMGFQSDMDTWDFGDDVVDEKQLSLRIGTMEGYLINGGYDPIIIKPMVRSRYWLRYKIVGGKPVFNMDEDTPADGERWFLLTDNGEGDHEDDEDSLFGNDRLQIDADRAERLNISDGTADTIDDIAYLLNIDKNYVVVTDQDEEFDANPREIMRDWTDGLEAAKDTIERNIKEFQETRVAGNYDERKARRGKKIRLLREVHSKLTQYEEVLDPSGAQRSQITKQIDLLRAQAQADRPGGGGGGGGGGDPRGPGRGIG